MQCIITDSPPDEDEPLKWYLWILPFLPILRKVFYRARDSPDDEEKEILSSTSSNVREIWDGKRVVRQTGESKTVPLVYNPKDHTLVALYDEPQIFSMRSTRYSGLLWKVLSILPARKFPIRHFKRFRPVPHDISPSITHNTPGIPRSTVKLLVITGLVFQATVVVVNALAVYRWQWLKSGKPIERYAYPLWAAGTGAITIGVWLCGWVVESSSEKMVVGKRDELIEAQGYRPLRTELPPPTALFDANELRIIFIQKELPAQNIPAYSIQFLNRKKMMYSRRLWPSTPGYIPSSQAAKTWRAREYRARVTCVSIGTLLTLLGFVGQNIGTRGLHWSAGLLQLGATATLTILRALVRRNVGRLVEDPFTTTIKTLLSGFEACQLSTELIELEVFLVFAPITVRKPPAGSENQHFRTILDIDKNDFSFADDNGDKFMIENFLKAQACLMRYLPGLGSVEKAAANCSRAMDDILDLILPGHGEAAWKDLGAFLCVAINNFGERAAAYTAGPKFRLIEAPTRRGERLGLLQAVINSTHYKSIPKLNIAFRILGRCAQDDVETRHRLLSAWIEPHRNPRESSRVEIGQPMGPTDTKATVTHEDDEDEDRFILFGLSLSHGFCNAM